MPGIATSTDIRMLRGHCRGEVLTRDDHRWDEVRQVCALAAEQQPAAIAFPRGEFDRAVITSFARAAGLKIAACCQPAGDDLTNVVLLADPPEGGCRRFARAA